MRKELIVKFRRIASTLATLAILLSSNTAHARWALPVGAPPANNPPGYVTASTTPQYRANALGVGTTVGAPWPAMVLELATTTKGFLPPRLTTAQRDTLSSGCGATCTGLTVYNTSTNLLQVFNGTIWTAVGAVPSALVNGIRGGVGAPAAGLGIDGDFYIDRNSSNIYGPKAGGAWGAPTSLLGTNSQGFPSGAVVFFNIANTAAADCPAGWSEYSALNGRYVVGLPAGGTLGGVVGTALANTEGRLAGAHTLNGTFTYSIAGSGLITVPNLYGYARVVGTGGGGFAWPAAIPLYLGGQAAGVTIPNTQVTPVAQPSPLHFYGRVNGGAVNIPFGGVLGTNAPYIQLLACYKN